MVLVDIVEENVLAVEVVVAEYVEVIAEAVVAAVVVE